MTDVIRNTRLMGSRNLWEVDAIVVKDGGLVLGES